MSGSNFNTADLADLPVVLFNHILSKLMDPRDFVRFGAVCKYWHLLWKDYVREDLTNPDLVEKAKLLPFLMLHEDASAAKKRQTLNLYSVYDKKMHKVQLHVPFTTRCCGSSHGWLAFAQRNMAITLINPFRRGISIALPPLDIPKEIRTRYYANQVLKLILTADPLSNPDDYSAVAIYSSLCRLAVYRSTQRTWIYMNESLTGFCDVIIYKGLVYAQGLFGQLISFDLNHCGQVNVVVGSESIRCRRYLVESSKGELLVVRRSEQRKLWISVKTKDFSIYKLPLTEKNGQLGVDKVGVTSLGRDALFVGANYSFSVSIPDAYENDQLKPNSIYYTPDQTAMEEFFNYGNDNGIIHPDDLGIFRLTAPPDENLEKYEFPYPIVDCCPSFGPREFHKPMPPAVWITPYQ